MAKRRTKAKPITKKVSEAFTFHRREYLRKVADNQNYDSSVSEINRLQRLMQQSGCWDITVKSMDIYQWADMEETLARGGWRSYEDPQRKAVPYTAASIGKLRRKFFAFVRTCAIRGWIDVAFYDRLKLLPKPRAGCNGVKGHRPVRAIAIKELLQYEPYVPDCLWDLMRLGWTIGARPGELAVMSRENISRVGDGVWVYRPPQHKKLWRLESREIYMGPVAVDIVKQYATLAPEEFIFAFHTISKQFHQLRFNKEQCERTWRRGKHNPERVQPEPIVRWQLSRFFSQAQKLAAKNGVILPRIRPNQLRHSAATRVREKYGLEGAAITIQDTQKQALIYAEKSAPLAIQIAKEMM